MKVLLTGFDPFGNESLNPALEVVKLLDGREIEGVQIVTQEVPTIFQKSIQVVIDAVKRHDPDVVLCIGQAGGRSHITPERVAINVDDARIPDNAGIQPIDTEVVPGGPIAYWSKLPIKKIVRELQMAGIPASVSNSAGTFVCNHLFYGVRHYAETEAPHMRVGFIHIPFLPQQTIKNGAPSLPLDVLVRGLEIAAVTAAKSVDDIRAVGGAIQ